MIIKLNYLKYCFADVLSNIDKSITFFSKILKNRQFFSTKWLKLRAKRVSNQKDFLEHPTDDILEFKRVRGGQMRIFVRPRHDGVFMDFLSTQSRLHLKDGSVR